jgi:hypothetical protein
LGIYSHLRGRLLTFLMGVKSNKKIDCEVPALHSISPILKIFSNEWFVIISCDPNHDIGEIRTV